MRSVPLIVRMMLALGCTVLVAHAFAYLLTIGLPRTGIAFLGIGAADPAALARWQSASDAPATYGEALSSLLVGNFHKTLDGVPTWRALGAAVANSLPALLFGNAITGSAVLLALQMPPTQGEKSAEKLLQLVAFFPPFLPGFLVFSLATASGVTLRLDEGVATSLIIGVCTGIAPACLLVAMVRASARQEMGKNYVVCMRAYGYTERAIARGIRLSVVLPCVSSAEKIAVMQLALLVFSEAIFSVPGFGSVLILAVQRNDVNVLLLAVTLVSMFVAAIRTMSTLFSIWFDPRRQDGS